MFGFKKEPEVIERIRYKFNCPHCGKENQKELSGGYTRCDFCGEFIVHVFMTGQKDIKGIYPLYKAKAIKEKA